MATGYNSIAFPSGRRLKAIWPHHLCAFKPRVHCWHITQMLLFITWHWLFAEWGMASRNLLSIPEKHCIIPLAGAVIVYLVGQPIMWLWNQGRFYSLLDLIWFSPWSHVHNGAILFSKLACCPFLYLEPSLCKLFISATFNNIYFIGITEAVLKYCH